MNMRISATDTLFHFCTKYDSIPDTNISYYGWEFGIKHKFYNYIKGYREAAECVYQRFVQSQIDNRSDIQDTICYPLIFIHRHCFELSLKFMYLNLFDRIDKDKAKKLIDKSHNLLNIWRYIKNDVENAANRIGVTIDYNAIENYVTQFDKEDTGSFDYRYPIDKAINEVHSTWKYLDIVNFHQKMNILLDYLQEVSDSIDYQLTELKLDSVFNAEFDSVLLESKSKIKELFSYYDEIGNREQQNTDKRWLQMSDIQMPSEEDQEKEYLFLESFSLSQKTLLIVLCYAGREIEDINLAVKKDERKRDVYRLLFNCYSSEYGFDIDDYFKSDLFHSAVIRKSRHNKRRILRILTELEIEL